MLDYLQILDKHIKENPQDALKYLPLLRGEVDEPLLYELGIKLDISPIINECCGEIVFDETNWEYICKGCAIVQNYVKSSISYSDRLNMNFTKQSEYSQIEYIKLILHELQCNKNEMEDSVIQEIYIHIKKKVNYENVRKSLRKLGYKQIYLKIPSILNKLDPINYPPLLLKSSDFHHIIRMFKKYSNIFRQLTPEKRMNRKNILNYHFMIWKITDEMGLTSVKKHLHVPKCKKTLMNHEKIWKEMQNFMYKK